MSTSKTVAQGNELELRLIAISRQLTPTRTVIQVEAGNNCREVD
ncbi:hypothetical protein [Kribbella sp. CA-293567]|nr:hypothetical protein [Kribbella sp. CA-293567]WBQ06196.1 hypothetical protein OX958_05165 [Kribbella sp. CA-293567]